MMRPFENLATIFRLDDFGGPILSESIRAGHGKAYRAQWGAAKKPATVHHETRQQRRAAARKALKGGE